MARSSPVTDRLLSPGGQRLRDHGGVLLDPADLAVESLDGASVGPRDDALHTQTRLLLDEPERPMLGLKPHTDEVATIASSRPYVSTNRTSRPIGSRARRFAAAGSSGSVTGTQ